MASVPEGGNGSQALVPIGDGVDAGGQVDKIQATLNMAEIEAELRLLRQQILDEKSRREASNTEHTQLIA